STSVGPIYGASAANISLSGKSWDGGNIGWIEDGSKKYYYIGELSGSYSDIFYDNGSGSRSGYSGTFSTNANGLFWDGSKAFWEQFSKIIPTIPGAKSDFFVPITETALRTFDVSISSGQYLDLKEISTAVGSVSITSGTAGKGIEISPGSGLFDVNVNGDWNITTGGKTIQNLTNFNGSISGSTSIGTSFTMAVDGGIKALSSTTAIVGADVRKSGDTDAAGGMIGKMTGSTSGTFESKAIGEIKSGFMLP
ncbi:MAG: hypothetical protein AB1488_10885, partial [Nitrospirota bacterium]